MSQNRYIYAEDNPMSFTDPTGHRPIGLDAQTEIEAKPVASTSTTTAGSTTTVTDVKVHPSGLTVTYATTPTTPTSVGSAPTTTASTTGGPPSQTCGRSRWESTCPDALTSGQVGMEEVIAIATAALIADVLLLDVPAASWYAANVGGALVYAYAKLIDYVDSS